MNQKVFVNGILSASILLSSASVIVNKVKAITFSTNSYSNCVNPGQFWDNYGIESAKYKAIYLGNCTRVGDKDEVKDNNRKVIPVSTPVISFTETVEIPIVESTPIPEQTEIVNTPDPTEKPTEISTNIPQETEVPTDECKNKNSGKDGTPNECNAGGGQEKHQ